jgi:hypothetical protein
MENLNSVVAFVAAHPVEGLVIASALINTALALRSPERLVAALERHPRGAALVGLVRALGIDPPAAIRAIQGLLTARAAAALAGHQGGQGSGGAGGGP